MEFGLKIMPVARCGAVGSCRINPSDYREAYASEKAAAARAMQALETARAKDVATHEANGPALENNRRIHEHVDALMQSIGMPRKFSERDRNSRARYPKTLTREAGYLADLRREVVITDEFDNATAGYQRLLPVYQQFKDHADLADERAAKEREQAAERERAERRANMELAQVLLRHGLDENHGWPEVLDALRCRDQRLDLAVAMQLTRGDWSEGPYRVRDALGRFTIHTDEDKDIVRSVSAGLVDFEDGRVFRDCAWSYGELFASVPDRQLAADVQLAMSRVE